MKIPYHRQSTGYNCAPASLQMLLEFFGVYKSQKELAKKLKTTAKDGTGHERIIDFVAKHGFFCYASDNSTLEEIKGFIKRGYPVLVNFIEPSDEEGHYALIVGINKNEIILNDPWNGRGFKISKADFKKRWRDSKNKYKQWMMVISRENFNLGKQFLPKK